MGKDAKAQRFAVFSECRTTCPHHVLRPNNAGGFERDCSHGENSPHLPTEQTPCDPRLCPQFTSNDEAGDHELHRYENEIQGTWRPIPYKVQTGFVNVATRAEMAEQRLKIAMDALNDIAAIPRAGRAARLARAVVRFIEETTPSNIGVRRYVSDLRQLPPT